jgi:hypothetical protein
MVFKMLKYGLLSVAGGAIAGTLVFGGDAFSYLRSSTRTVRTAVHDNIPVEFQLRRAHDLLDDILPEMEVNVRTIAQQEVEIDMAKGAILAAQKSLGDETARIQKLRKNLASDQTTFTFGDVSYSRDQLKAELARRFDRFQEAESSLAGQKKLLDERQRSIVAAEQQLDQMRGRKVVLETQVEALNGQFMLLQAASNGGKTQIETGKLAKAEKLVGEIRQQLNVAEHVLAREAKFIQPVQIDIVDEQDLVSRVDQHFARDGKPSASASAVIPGIAER